jgi:AcrR family transcriptional regulator
MLEAATAVVNRSGLTVSLEHISFEDVIRDAGVARSAVYRRWPYKDLFFSDLLRELAGAATPATDSAGQDAVELVRRVLLEHLDWLETAELRRALFVELLRQGAFEDFETLRSSTEWRTYIALHATFLSLADGDLRDDVQAALARSERRFVTRIAAYWDELADLLGYRLRPELNATFETVARVGLATMRGLALMALSTPGVATPNVEAKPFGAARTSSWSQPALAIAGIAFSFLEPDPGIAWDAQRITQIRQALESTTEAAKTGATA